MVGFTDGVIRVIRVLHDSDEPDLYGRKKITRLTLTLLKVMKPHTSEVNCMQIDQDCRYFATGVNPLLFSTEVHRIVLLAMEIIRLLLNYQF